MGKAMTTVGRLALALAGLGLAVSGATAAGAALADSRGGDPVVDPSALTGLLLDPPGDLLSWTRVLTTPILPVTELSPGETTSAVVGVRNETDAPVALSLQARNIDDDGELGDHLRFTITRDPERDGTFEANPVFSGTIHQLGRGTSLAGVELAGRSEWDYRVEASIDAEARNEVAGDIVSFALAWTATGPNDTTDTVTEGVVGPPSGGDDDPVQLTAGDPAKPGTGSDVMGTDLREDPASPARGLLPTTGTGLQLLLGGGLSLVVAGAGLRLARRRTAAHS